MKSWLLSILIVAGVIAAACGFVFFIVNAGLLMEYYGVEVMKVSLAFIVVGAIIFVHSLITK